MHLMTVIRRVRQHQRRQVRVARQAPLPPVTILNCRPSRTTRKQPADTFVRLLALFYFDMQWEPSQFDFSFRLDLLKQSSKL